MPLFTLYLRPICVLFVFFGSHRVPIINVVVVSNSALDLISDFPKILCRPIAMVGACLAPPPDEEQSNGGRLFLAA